MTEVLRIGSGEYVAAIVFVYGLQPQDWLGSVWRMPGEKWQVRYRFRYYDPEHPDPFAGKDTKRFVYAEAEATLSEEEVVGRFTSIARVLIKTRFNDKIDEVFPRTAEVDVLIRMLEEHPWAHVRTEARR